MIRERERERTEHLPSVLWKINIMASSIQEQNARATVLYFTALNSTSRVNSNKDTIPKMNSQIN